MKYYQATRSWAGPLGSGSRSLDGLIIRPNSDFIVKQLKAESFIFSNAGIVVLPSQGSLLVSPNSASINKAPTNDITLGTSAFSPNILAWLFGESSQMENIHVPITTGLNWFARCTTWSPALIAGETLVQYITLGYVDESATVDLNL